MIEVLTFLGFVAGLVGGYLVISRRAKSKFLATTEFWVYLPGVEMPSQMLVMDRMLNENPFQIRGRSPIGKNEGLVFSDIRLHIALVLRSKNPHVFRPDFFHDVELPEPAILDRLALAKSFVKLRYVSEIPLSDKRHLRFLAHAAVAYGSIGQGLIVYDVTSERLISRESFEEILRLDPDATGPGMHVRVRWKADIEGNRAETRGLAKIGLDELVTPLVRTDERVIINNVISEASAKLWANAETPETIELEAFGDQFQLRFRPLRDRQTETRILRIQNS
jgi:hypothetical protein